MELFPYLTFDGQAADAAAFYAEVMGDEPPQIMRFGDMPDQTSVTDENRDRVAHVRVPFADGHIMISDTPGTTPFGGHSGFSLNISLPDLDRAKAIFEKLSEGGEVTMAFEPTFWAKGFGTCTDRFGVGWMVNVE